MPTFPTPQPITATVEISAGSIRVIASDRDDAVVEVRPRDELSSHDVKAAEQVRVEFIAGTLSVSSQRGFSFPRRGAVVVDIALPSGSRLTVSAASANITAEGRYGDCRFATASGAVEIDSIVGNLKVDSASGDLSLRNIDGSAVIATASGDVVIGKVNGDVRFRAASGNLTVRWLHGHINGHTASGDVIVETAITGGLSVQSASGDIVVGIAEGTAAEIDARCGSGRVRNLLTPIDGPTEGDKTLAVHARTAAGDVIAQRATADVR